MDFELLYTLLAVAAPIFVAVRYKHYIAQRSIKEAAYIDMIEEIGPAYNLQVEELRNDLNTEIRRKLNSEINDNAALFKNAYMLYKDICYVENKLNKEVDVLSEKEFVSYIADFYVKKLNQ